MAYKSTNKRKFKDQIVKHNGILEVLRVARKDVEALEK